MQRVVITGLGLVTPIGAGRQQFWGALVSGECGIGPVRSFDTSAFPVHLGAEVKDSTPRNVQGGDGYYSKCNYYSVTPGKTLLMRVYQAAAGYDAQKELETVTKDTPEVKSVSGIGDKALVTSGTASGLPSRVLMLYVMKGNALITIGLSGLDDEVALEKAKGVAQKILAKL